MYCWNKPIKSTLSHLCLKVQGLSVQGGNSSSEEIKNLFLKKENQIKMEHCIQSYITSTSLFGNIGCVSIILHYRKYQG